MSFSAAGLAFVGYTTEFARTDVACGAPVAEARSEGRPAGLSPDEAEYVLRTGSYRALQTVNAEMVSYLEDKACTSSARSRLWKLGAATVVGWTFGVMSLRAAFRRTPKVPAVKAPLAA